MSIAMDSGFTLDGLALMIQQTHARMVERATMAVNASLTFRNWLIGMYISEYELRGADRAEYGENILVELSSRLRSMSIVGTGRRQLYNYIAFYRAYPGIMHTMSAQLDGRIPELPKKVRTLTAQSLAHSKSIVENLSYSHLELLVGIEDPIKRLFYEMESIRGNWSVRELKRQLASLYYERSALSIDKDRLSNMANSNAEKSSPTLTIRDPYVFEFLGLMPKDVMGESELEDSLLDRLQEFLLELGRGFCFEARQRRIMIGGEYFFVDLVFYHRILKCHVLIELKMDGFSHEHIGQLNTYVNWYVKNEMSEGDNQPIGILLCSKKNNALVEYALAGMDNSLFVSKYMLELPKKDDMKKFLEIQMNRKA
jgi:predicted nuclease of restriction endonuclease-like (RecB) superfamily